eukprot:6304388-Pyramimonas_sp.AAC.1
MCQQCRVVDEYFDKCCLTLWVLSSCSSDLCKQIPREGALRSVWVASSFRLVAVKVVSSSNHQLPNSKGSPTNSGFVGFGLADRGLRV